MEILELRDQLQDAQDAISEAHGHSAGLKEHNRQVEAQISRLEQQLADAIRWAACRALVGGPLSPPPPPPPPPPQTLADLTTALLVHGHAVLCSHYQQSVGTHLHKHVFTAVRLIFMLYFLTTLLRRVGMDCAVPHLA